MSESKALTNAACQFVLEQARIIQHGGEVMFLRLNGVSMELPSNHPDTVPEAKTIDLGGGDVVDFELKSASFSGDLVYYYLEVEPVCAQDDCTVRIEDDSTLRFSDGSTLTGPHCKRMPSGDLFAFYSWSGGPSGDGGQAKTWAETWTNHLEGANGDENLESAH